MHEEDTAKIAKREGVEEKKKSEKKGRSGAGGAVDGGRVS